MLGATEATIEPMSILELYDVRLGGIYRLSRLCV